MITVHYLTQKDRPEAAKVSKAYPYGDTLTLEDINELLDSNRNCIGMAARRGEVMEAYCLYLLEKEEIDVFEIVGTPAGMKSLLEILRKKTSTEKGRRSKINVCVDADDFVIRKMMHDCYYQLVDLGYPPDFATYQFVIGTDVLMQILNGDASVIDN